jgi:hypothetical protein
VALVRVKVGADWRVGTPGGTNLVILRGPESAAWTIAPPIELSPLGADVSFMNPKKCLTRIQSPPAESEGGYIACNSEALMIGWQPSPKHREIVQDLLFSQDLLVLQDLPSPKRPALAWTVQSRPLDKKGRGKSQLMTSKIGEDPRKAKPKDPYYVVWEQVKTPQAKGTKNWL